MTNFVTGLVCRGAGLPLPSSVRPAAGSPSTASMEGSRALDPSHAEFVGDRGFGFDVVRPEPSSSTARVSASASQVTSESERVTEKRSVRERETLPIQPRMEVSRASRLTAEQIPDEDYSSRRADNGARPAESSPLVRASATDENSERRLPQEPGEPVIARVEPKAPPPAASNLAPTHLLPKPEPSDKPERSEVGRVAEPAASANASSNRGRSPESRSIQVKIGKVEIRSNQPAPVVQVTRASRTSGFDDLQLQRTYLDRGTL
jgi:hypothetical protein